MIISILIVISMYHNRRIHHHRRRRTHHNNRHQHPNTVGGNTNGSVTNAPMGVRHLDVVCDNHHASGVAISSNTKVVVPAKRSVRPMACQVSGVRAVCMALLELYS